MATFTTSRPLNMEYAGHNLIGAPGTTHRLPDSLRQSFIDDFGNQMPALTWLVEDEIANVGGGPSGDHPDLATHIALGLSSTHGHDFAATVHAHAISSTTGLQTALDGKADSHSHPYAATVHSHVDSQIPATITRDTELTAAIAAHEASATHGGEGAGIPAGVIAMWGGFISAIPSGWLLCDGQNGTPDLRDRFIKGTGSDPGTTGGSSTHTHAAHTDVLNHTHGVTISDPGHDHVENSNNATTGPNRGWGAADTSTNTSTATGYSTASSTTGITATTANPAGGVASIAHDSPDHEPPFYSLAFIQKQ